MACGSADLGAGGRASGAAIPQLPAASQPHSTERHVRAGPPSGAHWSPLAPSGRRGPAVHRRSRRGGWPAAVHAVNDYLETRNGVSSSSRPSGRAAYGRRVSVSSGPKRAHAAVEPRGRLPAMPGLSGGGTDGAADGLLGPVSPGTDPPAAAGRARSSGPRDPGALRDGAAEAGGGCVMNRRAFLSAVTGSLLTAPLAAETFSGSCQAMVV